LSSALLIGDSAIDWRTARAASVPVCLARYGFGFDGFPLEQLGPEDRTITAPAEMLAL
jgi:phosphoglycolate phosphatase-like HAD superfamily hydrolase